MEDVIITKDRLYKEFDKLTKDHHSEIMRRYKEIDVEKYRIEERIMKINENISKKLQP